MAPAVPDGGAFGSALELNNATELNHATEEELLAMATDGDIGGALGDGAVGVSNDAKDAAAKLSAGGADAVVGGGEQKEPVTERRRTFVPCEVVWAKFKKFPWWPAHVVVDDMKTAEQLKQKHREGHVLVSFYGDKNWAWIDPEYMTPFAEDYDIKARDKRVQNALEDAMQAIKYTFENAGANAAVENLG